jgi:hypothetical protein
MVVGFAATSRQAKAADPSSIPIRPVAFDALYVVNDATAAGLLSVP